MSRLGGLALAAAAWAGGAHPMHTSVTEIVADAGAPVRIAIRVYADDLAGAVRPAGGAGPGGRAAADSAISRYVRGRFALRDRHNVPVPLRWDGRERSADAVIIRLRAAMPAGLGGARVANLLLTERFRDQVNVVRAISDGASATLLFTPGDAAKALP